MSSLSNHFCNFLKLCSEHKNQTHLKSLHCQIIKSLHFQDTFLAKNLISFYMVSGRPVDARNVFDQIPQPNISSFNALLSAYSKSGRLSDMLDLFKRMPVKDGVSWNLIISGFAKHGLSEDAVGAYRWMLGEGQVVPNRITFSTMLILSSSCSLVGLGRQVHCQIVKSGFSSNVFVGSPLVDMYSKAGLVCQAKQVFDELVGRNLVMYNTMIRGFLRSKMVEEAKRLFFEMPERDSISWTTMVTGLIQNGLEDNAIGLFQGMRREGIGMDQYTFGSVLTACGSRLALKQGREVHAYIIRTCYDDNIFVGSALVDMYSKCKSIKSAEVVFRQMAHKNIISWTAMLVGYGQNGHSEEAVKIFHEMQRNGIEPDDFTLGSAISSCANLTSLEEGIQFHCQAIVLGLISFITVSNAVITLYGKCGNIEDSHRFFDEMQIRDQVSWTALVSGYAQFGKAKETIGLFEKMLAQRVKPDGITFIGILSACSRAGLVEKGREYFKSMVEDHGIVPIADHYTCMIDLFSRSGRLKEAENFIKKMPYSPDVIGWATLLSSCRVHNNMEIGKWAAESLIELDPNNHASYVLLSSIHAVRGEWNEVAKLRKGMRDKRVKKDPGWSWIKYKNKVHIFSADDQSHPFLEKIYSELEKLNAKIIEEGYKPDMSSVLHDVTHTDKLDMLAHHSEKLAIAFGLLVIPEGLPIRVVKNLRVCADCHNATKFISKITRREILMRDAVRFHKFSDGVCSCGDFW